MKLRNASVEEPLTNSAYKRERGSSRSAAADSLLTCIQGVRGSERIRSQPTQPTYFENTETSFNATRRHSVSSSVPSNRQPIKPSAHRSSARLKHANSDDDNGSESDDDDDDDENDGGSLRRAKRLKFNSNQKSVPEKVYTTLSGRVVKPASQPVMETKPATNLRRSRRGIENDVEDDDSNDGDSDDEEEDDPRTNKTYSFRNRDAVRRETVNIQTLGGDGPGAKRSSITTRLRDSQTFTNGGYQESPKASRGSFLNPQPRLYLGGKIPNPSYYANKSKSKSSHHKSSSRSAGAIRRHFDSSSDSSSDDSFDRRAHRRGRNASGPYGNSGGGEDEDLEFSNYEKQRLQDERNSIVPINHAYGTGLGGSLKDKASKRDLLRADVNPVAVDSTISFQSIGGLEKHVHALKEMVLLPLLYPEVFARFGTEPPRGVLFLGPPGTGKTLTARALANSVSMGEQFGGRKISFFMRKGADCLSKWVGEGERQLRLLFEQAKKFQPSIIFFDEIDGLAPVRSVKQDQIHASIVSTLLALMDGLDARGQVVVIGATNRPDAIDPALRRPGRFDRELTFPLPNAAGRSAILSIHTAKWNPPLPTDTHDWIVKSTAGYCGADMKALCAEAALVSLRRSYPQVYESNTRLSLDASQLMVRRGDFAAALNKIVPCSQRTGIQIARQLDPILKPLLDTSVNYALRKLSALFPPAAGTLGTVTQSIGGDTNVTTTHATNTVTSSSSAAQLVSSYTSINQDSEEWVATLTDADVSIFAPTIVHGSTGGHQNLSSSNHSSGLPTQLDGKESWLWSSRNLSYRPRLLLIGANGMGQDEVAAAVLHQLESLPTFSLDIPSLVSDLNAHSPDQALVCRVQEACRVSPSVIYLPNILHWWASASEPLRTALYSLTELPTSHLPVLWLSTLMVSEQDVSDLQQAFDVSESNQGTSNHHAVSSPRGSVDSSPEPDGRGSIDIRLLTLLKWLSSREDFNRTSLQVSEMIERETPATCILYASPAPLRANFFQAYFTTLYQLPAKIYNANMSILKSRTQKLEIAADAAPENLSESIGKRTRSSSKNKNKRADESPHSHKADLNDADKQCKREIRTFFRAALSELMREKRCHVFNRPVDPEVVTDYYDIVKCPMDLETMRMKVDDDLYPTLAHFLRDITQIVYNAKMYNPLTRADQRGRSIVHAGHGMIDMVESHAFHFKEELGYDLFRKCEGIALREECDPPRPKPQSRDRMPEEDKKYYSLILEEHDRLRREEGRDDDDDEGEGEEDSDVDERDKERNEKVDKSNDRRRSSRHDNRMSRSERLEDSDNDDDDEEEDENSTHHHDSKRSSRHSQRQSSAESRRTSTSSQSLSHGKSQASRPSRHSKGSVESADSVNDKDFFACMDAVLSRRKPASKPKSSTKNESATSVASATSINEGLETEAEVDDNKSHREIDEAKNNDDGAFISEGESQLDMNNNEQVQASDVVAPVSLSTLTEEDIEHLPIIVNLRSSIVASEVACRGGLVETLAASIVESTEGWSVSQLMALMTKVNVIWRNFQTHGCWDISFEETEALVRHLKSMVKDRD